MHFAWKAKRPCLFRKFVTFLGYLYLGGHLILRHGVGSQPFILDGKDVHFFSPKKLVESNTINNTPTYG